MKRNLLLLSLVLNVLLISAVAYNIFNDDKNESSDESAIELNDSGSPLVNYSDYKDLVVEVEKHRSEKLVDLNTFLEMAENEDVIILDTRSERLYKSRHLKGAINLNFAEFTMANLAETIPSKDTKILIYCNNNFLDDPINFASKVARPIINIPESDESITLALNIPTYINLYGYGYENVYELSELVSVNDPRLEFEGEFIQ